MTLLEDLRGPFRVKKNLIQMLRRGSLTPQQLSPFANIRITERMLVDQFHIKHCCNNYHHRECDLGVKVVRITSTFEVNDSNTVKHCCLRGLFTGRDTSDFTLYTLALIDI